jgi:toxin-antitoxin system PIN domain toxin
VILLDVNVLVYAFRSDTEHHGIARAWLAEALSGQRLGVCDPVVAGFVRIVTNRKAFPEADTPADAHGFVDAVASSPNVSFVHGGRDALGRLGDLIGVDGGLRANLVPDAWIAATALAHGAAVVSFDADFRRFERLKLIHLGPQP